MYHQQRYLDYYETSANLDLCPSEAASAVSATPFLEKTVSLTSLHIGLS